MKQKFTHLQYIRLIPGDIIQRNDTGVLHVVLGHEENGDIVKTKAMPNNVPKYFRWLYQQPKYWEQNYTVYKNNRKENAYSK